jgi:hypothetical protein
MMVEEDFNELTDGAMLLLLIEFLLLRFSCLCRELKGTALTIAPSSIKSF